MRVLVTTAHRIADPKIAHHGCLIEIDWTRKEVLRLVEAPLVYAQFADRERGGRRGLRGITSFEGLIWVASSDTLWGLRPDNLSLQRIVTHPWMSSVHEIEASRDGVWVTSTGGNGIFLVGTDQQATKAAWLTGEPVEDLRIILDQDKYHINTVFETGEEVYAYANFTGQVFRMFPGPVEEVMTLETHCHNVVLTEFGWFRNQSRKSILSIGERSLEMPRRGQPGQFTLPGWLRGMSRFANGNFLVGTSPASLYEVDPHNMQIVDEMILTDDVQWTIHGIFVDHAREIVRPEVTEVEAAQRRLSEMFSEAQTQPGRNGWIRRMAQRIRGRVRV